MPFNPPTAAFDELRLEADGHVESLSVLGTVPARTALSGFAISQDASMLAYFTGAGFEAVSLAKGTGRHWPGVYHGNVSALSLSWAGDRTVSFEWGPGNNLHPPGLGLRVLDVTAPGNLVQASRLIVAAGRYCTARGAWCASPVITADGSKIMVGRSTVRGGRYSNSVMEFATRTGRAVAVVTSVIINGFPGRPCVPLWSNPAGEQVLSYCGRGERYDHGHISPITLHVPMYGTNLEPFAW